MRKSFGALILVAAAAGWRPVVQDAIVRVIVPDRVEMTVDSLDVTREGEWRVVSTRAAAAAPSISLTVAPSAATFVRFTRAGKSPITVPVAELLREPSWTLPPAEVGGEIAAAIETAAILPEKYRLYAGPSLVRTIEASGRDFVSIGGLSEGAYELEPLYLGGVPGARIGLSVTAGSSTSTFLRHEDVGAANVSASEGACGPGMLFTVRRLWFAGIGRPTVEIDTTDTTPCRWTIAGLSPGTYDATIIGREQVARSPQFGIVSQTTTTVTIPPPRVTVSGRLTYNGKPMAGADLSWLQMGQSVSATTRSDEDGRYRLSLALAGAYIVGLSGSGLMVPLKPADLHEGANTFDWDVKGGALTIRVHGWNQASPVAIEVRSSNPLDSQMRTLQPGDPPVIDRLPCNFGTYVVSASQISVDLIAREKKTLTFDEQHAEQAIDLELVNGRLRLVLRDASGQPITGAMIRDGTFLGWLEEVDSGVYRLDHVDPRALLRFKAGARFVPVCHTMPATDTLEITVPEGHSVELQLPPGEDFLTSRLGAFVDLEGSDCPIPLADFSSRKISKAGEPARYLVDGFPNARVVVWEIEGQRYDITVPDRGPIVLRR